MNNYKMALIILGFGILAHYLFCTNREGLENTEQHKKNAEQSRWQNTINGYTTQFSTLLKSINNNTSTITLLEENNKKYQQIVKCLEYREKKMNAIIEQNRRGRGIQNDSTKAKLKDTINTVRDKI